jgi:hypothetical protein
MKPIPTLLTLSALALAAGLPHSVRADDTTSNRRDYKSSTGGVILFGGSGDATSPAPTTGGAVVPATGGPVAPGPGGAAAPAAVSTPPAPVAPSTPPPPPPQRPGDRRSFNDPTGGVSIWLPGILNGPQTPAGPPQPSNRRDYP